MMEDDQQFCLRWNNHQSTLISVFDTLLENEKLVDCTLAAEGRIMKAHKVVLSACSPYFATLLQEQYDKHPIFILKDVKYQELRAMMDYMYRGEVNISQDQLAALLKAAESLQIKGLSDNRTGTAPRAEQQQQQQQQQHHRGLNVPGGSKLSGGYTLEAQTKRARVGAGPLDTQDISGSREGSSSPSRRRRKVRRRSVENAMAEPHDNSNSSQQQQSSLLQSNAGLAGVSAITAAASALASQLPTVSGVAATANAIATTQAAIASAQQQPQQQQQQPGQQLTTTTSVTKKTENVKGTSDAINTENVQVAAVAGGTVATGIVDNEAMEHVKTDKQNHKQKQTGGSSGKEGSELVIEPKSEYDEEGNDETCEDLTLDDEDMGMDDLDQNAGTSQGGEGSSQGYAAWQHDRSQDEILLSTQEAQQRDPQDLSRRVAHLHKENKAPSAAMIAHIPKANQRSILNTTERRPAAVRRITTPINTNGSPVTTNISTTANTIPNADDNNVDLLVNKRLSMVDVSGMLLEFYKTNVAKAPKTQQQQLQLKYRQTSPTSAETNEPSTIAAIATNGAAEAAAAAAAKASKNLQGGEVPMKACVSNNSSEAISDNNMKSMAFHPRIKYSSKNLSAASEESEHIQVEPTIMTAIPTSVVVPTSPQIDVKPMIHPTTGLVIEPPSASGAITASVIRPVPTSNTKTMPSAAAIAAALLQQQLRAQELHRQKAEGTVSTKILEKLLRQQRQQNDATNANDEDDNNDSDDEVYEERYNGFEDIHLTEDSKQSNYGVSTSMPNIFQASMAAGAGGLDSANSSNAAGEYFSTQSQKLFLAQAQAHAMRNFEYSLSDFSGNADTKPGSNRTTSPHNGSDASGEAVYECRHCGKRYRWKSTLRRHENVECGGKEPSHQCPYCPYKSKQRGNLGVHVRKHHTDLPQLASKRRSKYSQNINNGMGAASEHHNSNVSFSGNASDDSSSKLVIDFKIKSPQNDSIN